VPRGDPLHVRINEWLADSAANDDFVELYNPDPAPVDIGRFHLSDAPQGAPELHELRPLTFIAANGYLTFIADGNDGPDHLSFSLAPEQGMIGFTDPNLVLVDCIFYEPQRTDVSQGRRPNGTGNIAFFAQPTPGAGNPAPTLGVTIITNQVALMPLSKTWKYDQVNDFTGVNWTATNFNDASWASGNALLGFENDAVAFSISTPLNIGRLTYYFRTTVRPFRATSRISRSTPERSSTTAR
jgi:hypothetical protein